MLNFGLLGKGPKIPFNGGIFSNGGFEDGLTGWVQSGGWSATPDEDTARNVSSAVGAQLYQNINGFEIGATYEITADKLEGDAEVAYLVNDASSGVPIGTPYQWVAAGANLSTGVEIDVAGTVPIVVDNLRLTFISGA